MPRNRATIVYLEANAVGHLMPAQDTTIARNRRARIARRVNEGGLEIVASPILLEELAAIGVRNWPAHIRVLGYLRNIASPRVQLHPKDLIIRELRARHSLHRPGSRLNRSDSDELWKLVMDPQTVVEVTQQAQEEAEEFLREQRTLRVEAKGELRKGTPPDDAVEPNVWLWWTGEPIEHIRYFAKKTAQSFGADSVGLELQRMPALWRFNAYKAARIALMHSRREGGALQKTDAADALHYATAAYADVFVSDDGPLHRTAEIIPNLRRPITLDDFDRDYLG